jgi:molybdopterin-guanine dinucleotide biosynthesis protein A
VVIIDAVVLAGGRSSRLGGASKAALVFEGRTLLELTLAAVAVSRAAVIVGDANIVVSAAPAATVPVTRETPPFAGPAAAIATGVEHLAARNAAPSDFTLVLACDMPRVGELVNCLLSTVEADGPGVVALSSDGRTQQLAGVYRTDILLAAVRSHRDADDLENLSVRALLATVEAQPVAVPVGSTDDIDTWEQAAQFGIPAPAAHLGKPAGVSTMEQKMSDKLSDAQLRELLQAWSDDLLKQLGLPGAEVDIDGVLGLAGDVAHGVVRPAAPLTAFLVGLAVGRALESGGQVQAFADASSIARALAATGDYAPAP